MDGRNGLKIVHVTSYQVPEYGYEELALGKAQYRLGNDVTIVTSNYLHPRGLYAVLRERFPERQVAPRQEQQDGVRILRLASSEIGTRTWIQGLAGQLVALQPDVIHCHNVLVFHPLRIALLKWTRRLSCALVVDDHTLYNYVRRDWVARAFYFAYRNLLHPLLAKQVDSFCAATPETREYLRTFCGIRGRIEVMPLGVDADAFAPAIWMRTDAREKLGYGSDDFVILYTGKVVPGKAVDLLVRAAISLNASQRPAKALIVGDADPAYKGSLDDQISQAEQQANVRFLPSVRHDQLPGVYAAADVAVWPGSETMAVYEAMSMAVPVIVPASSGYSKLVAAGPGLTFRQDDEASLAATIARFLSPSVREQHGAAGRHLIEQTYSWHHAAERYLSEYRSILGGLRPAPMADTIHT